MTVKMTQNFGTNMYRVQCLWYLDKSLPFILEHGYFVNVTCIGEYFRHLFPGNLSNLQSAQLCNAEVLPRDT